MGCIGCACCSGCAFIAQFAFAVALKQVVHFVVAHVRNRIVDVHRGVSLRRLRNIGGHVRVRRIHRLRSVQLTWVSLSNSVVFGSHWSNHAAVSLDPGRLPWNSFLMVEIRPAISLVRLLVVIRGHPVDDESIHSLPGSG